MPVKKSPTTKRLTAADRNQQSLFAPPPDPIPEGDGCHVVPVGKRRDGGTRYWCSVHKADIGCCCIEKPEIRCACIKKTTVHRSCVRR